MHIDFAQFPAFLGIIVIAVGLSFVGNVLGLILGSIYRTYIRKKSSTGEDTLKVLIYMASTFLMTPFKIGVAFVAASIITYICGSVAAAALPVSLTCGAIGLLFSFSAINGK